MVRVSTWSVLCTVWFSRWRVGHEYLINNYYRDTLYFCVLAPFASSTGETYVCRRPRTHRRSLTFSSSASTPFSPSLPLHPSYSSSSSSTLHLLLRFFSLRAPCRHICIFIRECNRRARFSPLVARYRGKNSRKMAERFEADMRSDFLCSPYRCPAEQQRIISPVDLEETIVVSSVAARPLPSRKHRKAQSANEFFRNSSNTSTDATARSSSGRCCVLFPSSALHENRSIVGIVGIVGRRGGLSGLLCSV